MTAAPRARPNAWLPAPSDQCVQRRSRSSRLRDGSSHLVISPLNSMPLGPPIRAGAALLLSSRRCASDRFATPNLMPRMSLKVRLRVLPLPIALPQTCRSRWPAELLTFAYTRSRPSTGRPRAAAFVRSKMVLPNEAIATEWRRSLWASTVSALRGAVRTAATRPGDCIHRAGRRPSSPARLPAHAIVVALTRGAAPDAT